MDSVQENQYFLPQEDQQRLKHQGVAVEMRPAGNICMLDRCVLGASFHVARRGTYSQANTSGDGTAGDWQSCLL